MSIKPPSPPYLGPAKWHGPSTNKPIARIVVHATDGAEPHAGAARATVASSKATTRPSSFHYCADSTESVQYAYDSVVAYHAPPNEHSIGYELCCDLSDEGKGHWERADHQAMLDIAAEDIARLCLAYDVPIVKLSVDDLKAGKHGLCGHIDVSNAWHQTTHWDPGPYFPWSAFIGNVKAAADRLKKAPAPVPAPSGRRLTLGTFNVERGRPKNVAVGDVVRLFEKHDLKGLAVQEAEQYADELARIPGLDYFADPDNKENALLVPTGRGTDFVSSEFGDGWTRVGGAKRGSLVLPRVTIDGWCRLASKHDPPGTLWANGELQTAPERVDDVRESAEVSVRFLTRDNLTRVLTGDWNEPPETGGEWSPRWVAEQAGAERVAPKSRAGHGRIDWPMVVRGHLANVIKDTEIREGSDHEPVVFDVVESA